jgi:pantoate--beta-alanine ligase
MTEVQVFEALPALSQRLQAAHGTGHRIGLVPTMGNLHEGHLNLVRAARERCDYVLCTIFVNPLQFGPSEDYTRYPRTFATDVAALQSVGCDAVYVPAVAEIYPEGLAAHTRISVPLLSNLHCGASRPGHFDGVCTVVCKLFNMTRPDLAVFGLKDFQQYRIISKMVDDLHLPVQLLGMETVREASGLALSSRNSFLSTEERIRAQAIYATLQATAEKLRQGQRNFPDLETSALSALEQAGLRPDYFHICKRSTLQAAVTADEDLVILAAAFAGNTRLIDNIQV